jgi:hypothetical protein
MNDPDPHRCYNQSSLALLLDSPQSHLVESFQPVSLWIAPAGITYFDFMGFLNDRPTSDQLKDLEWVEVKIGCAPEQIVVFCVGSQTKWLQFALKHLGTLTISKAQGYTIITLLLKYLLNLLHGNLVKLLFPCPGLHKLLTTLLLVIT